MGGRILQNVIFISAFQKRVIKILCVQNTVSEFWGVLQHFLTFFHEHDGG